MILFSPAKINLGLRIVSRRTDGYHNLESIMIPVPLQDILEIKVAAHSGGKLEFSQSGIRVETGDQKNLCEQAYELLEADTSLPRVQLHLHKQIPVGAGLGGGSSNATATLKGLNMLAADPVSFERLIELAGKLGSDCPYFMYDGPMIMEGRGEILSPVHIDLDQLFLVLLNPGIYISTAEAYAGVIPAIPRIDLRNLVKGNIHTWKREINNDFETSIFLKYPELTKLKEGLYESGAIYASLSGSGSSLYGFFSGPPRLPGHLKNYTIWEGIL